MVTVVTGSPRSGTSLAMQMLAAGGVPVLHDSSPLPERFNPGGCYEWSGVGELSSDPARFADADGRAVKVLAYAVPHMPLGQPVRVIYMQRPMDACVRSWMNVFPATDPADYATRLMERDLAARQHLAAPGVSVLYVDYADLIKNPVENCLTIAEFVGLPKEAAVPMAACVKPELMHHG